MRAPLETEYLPFMLPDGTAAEIMVPATTSICRKMRGSANRDCGFSLKDALSQYQPLYLKS
eukprot:5967756-Prymnesium_polylepis.2